MQVPPPPAPVDTTDSGYRDTLGAAAERVAQLDAEEARRRAEERRRTLLRERERLGTGRVGPFAQSLPLLAGIVAVSALRVASEHPIPNPTLFGTFVVASGLAIVSLLWIVWRRWQLAHGRRRIDAALGALAEAPTPSPPRTLEEAMNRIARHEEAQHVARKGARAPAPRSFEEHLQSIVQNDPFAAARRPRIAAPPDPDNDSEPAERAHDLVPQELEAEPDAEGGLRDQRSSSGR